MARKPKDPPKLNLRLDADMRSQLEEEAQKNGTSLQTEIVARLQNSFGQTKIATGLKRSLQDADVPDHVAAKATEVLLTELGSQMDIMKELVMRELRGTLVELVKRDLAEGKKTAVDMGGGRLAILETDTVLYTAKVRAFVLSPGKPQYD